MEKEIRIFIVEDDSVFIKLLNDVLLSISKDYEADGINFSIKTFYSIKEARFELSQNPDIVLLDYYLTDDELNPVTSAKFLEETVNHDKEIDIIVVSGEDDPEIIEELKEKGAAFFISKSPKSLMRIIPILKSIIDKNISSKL